MAKDEGNAEDSAECAPLAETACTTFSDDPGAALECNWVPGTGSEQILAQDVALKPGVANTFAIADSSIPGGPMPGGTDSCIGVSWKIDPTIGNIIQSDDVKADVTFSATQSRNNKDFVCTPGPEPTTLTVNKI